MNCRSGCGACCIVISISSPIPGMENGKPAGVRCIHLKDDLSCAIYDRRPPVCANLKPAIEICGNNREEAMRNLTALEDYTKPCH